MSRRLPSGQKRRRPCSSDRDSSRTGSQRQLPWLKRSPCRRPTAVAAPSTAPKWRGSCSPAPCIAPLRALEAEAGNRERNMSELPVAKIRVAMNVNGQAIEADVEPRLLLIHFLRENLNITGPHIGCD